MIAIRDAKTNQSHVMRAKHGLRTGEQGPRSEHHKGGGHIQVRGNGAGGCRVGTMRESTRSEEGAAETCMGAGTRIPRETPVADANASKHLLEDDVPNLRKSGHEN